MDIVLADIQNAIIIKVHKNIDKNYIVYHSFPEENVKQYFWKRCIFGEVFYFKILKKEFQEFLNYIPHYY